MSRQILRSFVFTTYTLPLGVHILEPRIGRYDRYGSSLEEVIFLSKCIASRPMTSIGGFQNRCILVRALIWEDASAQELEDESEWQSGK